MALESELFWVVWMPILEGLALEPIHSEAMTCTLVMGSQSQSPEDRRVSSVGVGGLYDLFHLFSQIHSINGPQ